MELRFPLFMDLTGKPAVVVGGGTIGLRRAGVLRDFGAAVTVIAPEVTGSLDGVKPLLRAYCEGDLAGAFLAVAATNDRRVNHAVYVEAKRRGILVNVCDCQSECDFFFPSCSLFSPFSARRFSASARERPCWELCTASKTSCGDCK